MKSKELTVETKFGISFYDEDGDANNLFFTVDVWQKY